MTNEVNKISGKPWPGTAFRWWLFRRLISFAFWVAPRGLHRSILLTGLKGGMSLRED